MSESVIADHPEFAAVGAGEDHPATEAHQPLVLAGALITIYAGALDELEAMRIATRNRLQALREVKGLADSPEERQLLGLADGIGLLEAQATKNLRQAMRIHPLGSFVEGRIGLGTKQTARLLAAIGDPSARPNVAKLWAYCGYVPGQKRQRGVRSNWNATAKMRAFLCAESCIKHRHSPYRAVYDREREKWIERDTTDLHKHNHALRVVAKTILKDLWVEARAISRQGDEG